VGVKKHKNTFIFANESWCTLLFKTKLDYLAVSVLEISLI